MTRLSTPLALALAAALSLPSLAQAQSAPAQAAGVQAAGTVETARYATLAEAVAATVTQEAKLIGSDVTNVFDFGTSVSISGDRALVGAPFTDEGNLTPGAAYVFAFNGTSWSQEEKLTADDAAPGDVIGARFGGSVSLDGERALIGAYADELVGGSAYVFTLDGTAWSQQAKLTASDAAAFDEFGSSVSLSGERALIGARNHPDTGPGSSAGPGAAYVFAFDGAAWSQQAKLTAADGANLDEFGESVSLSGERALIGASQDNGATGAAYMFVFDGASWSQQAKLTASDADEEDRFGFSVSLDGDRALVGARWEGDAGGSGLFSSGAAYLFAFEGAGWSQQAKLKANDASAGDQFGYAVSLDGERALIGAWLAGAGAAYVFDLGLGAPLVADAGPNKTVVAGQTVTLDGTGSTGATTFAWTLSGGATLSGAGTATPTFCAAAPGAYTATLTVSDGAGGSDSDNATVTVQSPSAALVAIAGGVSAATALNPAQKAALVAELKKAQRALARGLSPTPFLNAFRSQVQGLQAQGVLTAGQAGALIGLVDAVDAAVASPCSQAGAPSTASATAAEGFGLSVWPNPSAGRATVAFSVEAATDVRLSVVDALGREVAVLREGSVEAGRHEAVLDAEALPAGTYLVRLATGSGQTATERITRLR